MTLPTRWIKLVRDFEDMAGRLVLVVLAITFGLICTVAITLAYVTLTRDISTSYTATNPASGILDIGRVDAALVSRVQAMDGVAEAEAFSIFHIRTQQPDGSFGRGILFVSPDPLGQRVGKVGLEQSGSVAGHSVLLERRSLAVAGVEIGGTVALDLPGIGFTDLRVAATVFDPALAPAEQEQAVYAYMDTATWFELGGAPLEMIKLRVAGDTADQRHVDDTLARVAGDLRDAGVNVHLVQIPRAETHPHQSQMNAVLALFLAFGIVAFLLSAFLVSVTIDGLMVQQIRQIGVMKAIGARTAQIRSIYLVGVACLGAVATFLAIPFGQQAGRSLAQTVAQLLNFDLTTTAAPAGLLALWGMIGLAVPVLFALVPLARATAMPVTAALSDQGIDAPRGVPRFLTGIAGSGVGRLALAGVTRNAMRSALIVGLLAAAGAVTLTARNVSASYGASVAIAAQERRHDIDIRLKAPISVAEAADLIAGVGAEPDAIGLALEAAPLRDDGLTIVRTYPDGGHGSLTLMALPSTASIAQFEMLSGEVNNSFANGIILNQAALPLLGFPTIGEPIRLSLDGTAFSLPLRAVIRQYMTPATAFASAADLAAQTGFSGVNMVRLITSEADGLPGDIDTSARDFSSAMASFTTENLMVQAISGHVNILIATLTALGAMIAVVGFAGLAAAQGISIIERRREFGVLRAIGARRGQVLATLLIEGGLFWVAAMGLAVILSLPFSLLIGGVIGRMSFGMPLPFTIDASALSLWAAVSLIGALMASLPPGLSAARSTVTTSLNHT